LNLRVISEPSFRLHVGRAGSRSGFISLSHRRLMIYTMGVRALCNQKSERKRGNMKAATQSYRPSRLFNAVNRSIQHLITPAGLAALAFASLAPSVQAQEVEEIRVTGSRLVRTTMETPTPVTTMEAAELQAMAPGNLIDGLQQMPQFYNNQTPDQS